MGLGIVRIFRPSPVDLDLPLSGSGVRSLMPLLASKLCDTASRRPDGTQKRGTTSAREISNSFP